MSDMKRWEFITLLGGAAAAWPLGALAQQADRLRHIGVLMASAADDAQSQARIAAFLQGLQQLGWTDGRNVRIDTRWATTNPTLAVLAGWNVRRVEIPWVRWCNECATAEHPFKPVRTSFHTVCLGVKHPSHRGAPWCNGATARRRLRVLRVTCNAGDVRCRPWSTTMRRQTGIQSAIDGFICHALGPVEDQS
jgi:hypothetical protein